MIKIAAASILSLIVTIPFSVRAQEIVEPEPTPWYENNEMVPRPVNTGPLAAVGNETAADIVTQADEDAAGALKGEITIKQRDGDIMEVYANGNLVEKFIKGSGGTGNILEQSLSKVVFQPSGRPALDCPAQDSAGWFGPCKLQELQ